MIPYQLTGSKTPLDTSLHSCRVWEIPAECDSKFVCYFNVANWRKFCMYFHLGTQPVLWLSQLCIVTYGYNNFIMVANFCTAGVRLHNGHQGSNWWYSATLAYESIAPMTVFSRYNENAGAFYCLQWTVICIYLYFSLAFNQRLKHYKKSYKFP